MPIYLLFFIFIINFLTLNPIYAATNFNTSSKENYEDFPFHEFAKSPLRDLKVPDNWKLFKDPLELSRFHDRFKDPVHEKHAIDTWKMNDYIEDCERALSEFDLSWLKHDMPERFARCKTVMTQFHFRNRDVGIKPFERILLSWAETKPVVYRSAGKTDADDQAYAAAMTLGDFASFYAVYYEDFDFTINQRNAVDEYLSDWLINHDLKPEPGKVRCNLEKPEIFEKLNDYTFDNDYCGSNRWRVGLGAVYLGLRTGNQKLFTAGNRHIEINLATIDKDGIFPSWARKGALALSYQRQLPEVLTLLAVAYETIGYDFYEHQLPHGKKIHQVYEALFDFIYHPEKLNKYAFARPNYNGEDVYAFNKLPLSEKWKREIIDLEVLATQSKGYVLRYRPDLEDKINFTERWDQRFGTWKDHIAVFVSISGLAIYESANQNVSKIIIQETMEKIRLERLKISSQEEAKALKEAKEKEAKEKKEKEEAEKISAIIKKNNENKLVREEACKESGYNGEYTVEWFFGNVNNNQKLEYQGSESLILDKCVGEFDGEKNFQPTKELRKKLKVNYQPNGQIHISGRLDLFEKNNVERIELKGDINIGEASGKTRAGDLIKIVIVKKATAEELIEKEAACEASVYNGEYTVEWFFGNVNNNQKLEYQGSESLVLSNCTGKFDGEKDFQPTKELRKKLKVNYQPNGTIHVAGRLDLFEKGDMEGKIELKGDINIGEASGKTRAGDLIKIVIVKKAQRSTLFDGRYTFNLFRFSDEDSMKLGSGGITIKDGKIIINNEGRLLKTGSEDLYDSLEAQINKNGVVSGSIEIDILGKQERTENYDLEGTFNDKIWGSSPDEEYFKIYFIFK